MSILDSLLSLVAPHECLGCSVEGSLLCYGCRLGLRAPEVVVYQSKYLDQVMAATIYSGLAKDLVWNLKFGGAQAAVRPMVQQMTAAMSFEGFVIVPVPTATSRQRRRGYDQATLLARALARRANQTYLPCLRRLGQAHQVGAGRAQRLAQLEQAFQLSRPQQIRGQHILLIDDVITTGATFEAAAQVLRLAGAAKVSALAFAYAE